MMPHTFSLRQKLLIFSLLAFLLVGVLLTGGIVSQAAGGGADHALFMPLVQINPGFIPTAIDPNTLIIGMPEGVSNMWVTMVLDQNFGGQVQDSIPQLDIYRVYFPQGMPSPDVQAQMKDMLNARFIEPDMLAELFETRPNDDRYNDQWAHEKIESPRAWDVTQGSADVVVAIVDTGMDLNHPDLKDRLTSPDTWYDYGEDDDDPSDTYGHGTHVAGIVGATGNNSQGVAGAGWRTSLMPVKVFPDGKGSTSMYTVAKGVVHAVDKNADIINLSLGGSRDSDAMRDAVNYAYDHDVLVVAAAGNDDHESPSYPAANEHVLAVAATDQQDKKASFSNYGDWVDISSPGVSILSTMPTYHVKMNDNGVKKNYDYLNGTSMATPLVAGVAALVKAVHPSWKPDRVTQYLQDASDDIDDKNPDYAGKLGAGRVNAGNALAGDNQPTPTPTATPTATPTSEPTATPTATPTSEPTATPTATPTVTPTSEPTATPTSTPTSAPTATPTATPTSQPTATPTATPTTQPTATPTATPLPTTTPPNLLPNPSFEMGGGFFGGSPDNWDSSGSGAEWSQDEASDGSHSLSIGSCMFFGCGYWESDPVSVDVTHRYKLSGDIMRSSDMTPGLAFEQWDAAGNFLGELTVPITQTLPASVWNTLDAVEVGAGSDIPFDPATASISLRLLVENGSAHTIWYDNFYLGDFGLPADSLRLGH